MTKQNVTIFLLVLVSISIMAYKIIVLGFSPRMVIPRTSYEVDLNMKINARKNNTSVQTFAPISDAHQKLIYSKVDSSVFNFSTISDSINNKLVWNNPRKSGRKRIGTSWQIIMKKVDYSLPNFVSIPNEVDAADMGWLSDEKLVEVSSKEIDDISKKINIKTDSNVVSIVKKAYIFAADSIKATNFSGNTSALTALKLREGSCNGKSRLMVALVRNRGIPARVIGGIILKKGKKRTTHQWLEVLIGSDWVPFDPLNHHFASIPINYLTLYKGDEAMFKRSANRRFYFNYSIEKYQSQISDTNIKKSKLDIMQIWNTFKEAGISLSLLKILLMIPIGAIVIIIFRNVIGLHTFGTFLPVLIAASYHGTGLFWGNIIFISMLLIGALIRYILDGYSLLHSPKLTIILIFVIVGLIMITLIGIELGNRKLYAASMFPLAILSITIERFSVIIETHGFAKAFNILFSTIIVVSFCYVSMQSVFMQSFFMVFPESFLIIIAISFYLGRWNYIRIMELIRFRKLIFEDK